MPDKSSIFWTKRILQYLNSEWSLKPSPFAVLTGSYLTPGSNILELGCGAGQDGLWFASQGYPTTMSDYLDVGFSEISKRASESGVEDLVQTQIIDASNILPYNDASFDCIYAQLSLHYFTENFAVILLDNKGKTPKDDAKHNSAMIRFIGKKS